MFHIREKVSAQIEVKKSKFICILFPLNDDTRIKEIISQLKKDYPAATHYCYGSSISGNCRSNDDGEPSSTAGKPILQHLLNHELDNVLAVVIRYFGGTLLGTAGLVKAYGDACESAIAQAQLTIPVLMHRYHLEIDYPLMSRVEFILEKNGKVLTRDYGEKAIYQFVCQQDICEQLKEVTNGQLFIRHIEDTWEEKPIIQ